MSDKLPEAEAIRKRADALRAGEGRSEKLQRDTEQGIAFRIATEIIVATGVGLFLGYWIDVYLHSKPIAMLVGLMLDIAAGIRSAIRANDRLSAGPSESPPQAPSEPPES